MVESQIMKIDAYPKSDGVSSEANRRLYPRIWDVDYSLLRGLANEVRRFASSYARTGMTVLDYGCGSKPYSSLFPADCTYLGVDVGDNPHADIIIEPEDPIPLSNGIIDLILSTQVVYKIPDYMHYLSECCRLLHPNGRIFITTHGAWTYLQLQEETTIGLHKTASGTFLQMPVLQSNP